MRYHDNRPWHERIPAAKLRPEIECLRREISAAKAGRTVVTRDWLRAARVELRAMIARYRSYSRAERFSYDPWQILHRI